MTDPDSSTTDDPSTTGDPDEQIAFRFTSLYVRDPHLWVQPPLSACQDGTDNIISTPLGDEDSVNTQFNNAINGDSPDSPDGNLDLSLVLIFRPLDQGAGASGDVDFANATCPIPADNTVCDLLAGSALTGTTYANMDGVCLEPVPADLSPAGYAPAPGTTNGPCFAAGPANVTIQTSFAALPLDNATIAAQYVGDPADGLMQGTIRGFITVANAESIMLPEPLNLAVEGGTLAGTLPGHENCCAEHDDRDEGGTGWWFYADFTGAIVPWTGA